MLETVKGYYNGSQIVLAEPVDFQQGQEVIVTYTLVQPVRKKSDNETLVDSLVGAIPDSGKSLSEYRNERLKKLVKTGENLPIFG